ADMARRMRKEHKAHEIGACIERRVERRGRLQATDLDQDGHAKSSCGPSLPAGDPTPALEHFAKMWSPGFGPGPGDVLTHDLLKLQSGNREPRLWLFGRGGPL